MPPTAPRPDPSLPEWLAAHAHVVTDRRLALDLLGGGLAVAAAARWRPTGWPAMLAAGACFVAFGADRGCRRRNARRGPPRLLAALRLPRHVDQLGARVLCVGFFLALVPPGAVWGQRGGTPQTSRGGTEPPRPSASDVRTSTAPASVDPSPHRIHHVVVERGVQLEVLDWGGPARGGRGPPLVFLAGFGNTAHVFDGFAPQFRDRHRVVAITRRGFGASTLATAGYDNATLVRDVLAVVDALRLERPTFVAHSFGGAELNGVGVRRPRAARALVYLDGGFDFAALYADARWMHVPIPHPPAPPAGDGAAGAEVARASQEAGPGYPEAEVRARAAWLDRVRRAPAFHADSLADWLVRGTPPSAFGAIRVPALAIYGVPATAAQKYPWAVHAAPDLRRRAERRFAVEAPLLARQRARFRGEVPGARVVEIAGGRHYVFLTHPREVARAIRAFAE